MSFMDKTKNKNKTCTINDSKTYTINDNYADSGTTTARTSQISTFHNYGWICPVCGRGLSPTTSVCPCRLTYNWNFPNWYPSWYPNVIYCDSSNTAKSTWTYSTAIN